MKYYYILNNDGTIKTLNKSRKVAKNGTEISREAYNKYLEVLKSIPEKEGYNKIVHLYPDFTYTVEYVEIQAE